MNYYKNRTISFLNSSILEGYSVVGPKENQGRFRGIFDLALQDDKFGQQTFERAERKMFEHAIDGVIAKSNLFANDIDAIIGGDLLNQIVSCAFASRKTHCGFLGLYNACATFVESLIVASSMIANGLDNVVCVAGSHFSTAERQYRYPLELGVLRSPVTQWTATGVGAVILSNHVETNVPKVSKATIGRVVDYGILDVNNMGAAMAPSACDMICTGDLGKLGSQILHDLTLQEGYDISNNHFDCGASLYYSDQKTYQGASGAACSAIIFASQLLGMLRQGNYKKILLAGTGALMSPTTSFQGDSIPAITHLVEVCS